LRPLTKKSDVDFARYKYNNANSTTVAIWRDAGVDGEKLRLELFAVPSGAKTLTCDVCHIPTTAQIDALSTADVQALTTQQVPALNSGQVAALSTADIVAFGTATISVLSTAGVTGLTTAQIVALSSAQVAVLTSTEISAMSTVQLLALTTAQVVGMTSAQMSALTTVPVSTAILSDLGTITLDPPNPIPVSIPANSTYDSGVMALTQFSQTLGRSVAYNNIAVALTSSQVVTITVQRYLDAAGLIKAGAAGTVATTANVADSVSLVTAVAAGYFKFTVANATASLAVITNAGVAITGTGS
jgi:hypothetical protein